MNLKIIALAAAILAIIGISLFWNMFAEKASKNLLEDVPQYNCGKDNFCTSCMINGIICSCGEERCECGNKSVDANECLFL